MSYAVPGVSGRRFTLIAAALAAAAIMTLSTAAPASALATDGCTGVSGGGYTCFGIYSTGSRVDSFYQSRGGVYPICNYQARFTVSQNNSTYWSRWSSYHSGCMYFPRATRSVSVNAYFRKPSKACGSWYENGSRLGTACNYIW